MLLGEIMHYSCLSCHRKRDCLTSIKEVHIRCSSIGNPKTWGGRIIYYNNFYSGAIFFCLNLVKLKLTAVSGKFYSCSHEGEHFFTRHANCNCLVIIADHKYVSMSHYPECWNFYEYVTNFVKHKLTNIKDGTLKINAHWTTPLHVVPKFWIRYIVSKTDSELEVKSYRSKQTGSG